MDELIAEFWRAQRRFFLAMGPPVLAGALLLGCPDDTVSGPSDAVSTSSEVSDQVPKDVPDEELPEEPQVQDGRPFLVAGDARTGAAVRRADWSTTLLTDVQGLTADERDAIARRWTVSARAEHASVASFARFTLELLHLGAPAELVEAATAAQLDEVKHARISFALASAYAGHDIGPGPVDIEGCLEYATDPAAALRSVILEGCVDETLAAAEVRLAALRATAPAVREALTEIADDEARHAELAWRTARWMLEQNPELHAVAKEAFDSASRTTRSAPSDHGSLEAHGLLSPSVRRSARAAAMRDIVQPCRATLLG